MNIHTHHTTHFEGSNPNPTSGSPSERQGLLVEARMKSMSRLNKAPDRHGRPLERQKGPEIMAIGPQPT